MRKKLLTYLSIFLLFSCTKVVHQAGTSVQSLKIEDTTVIEDTTIASLIIPYKTSLDSEMNTVIGICSEKLVKEQPESTLGNWMTDVMHQKAEVYFDTDIDFAIQNYGGIRIPYIVEGEVTKGKIFELMPFENRMVLMTLKGTVVQQLFDHIAALGGWPVSKAVQFEIVNASAKSILLNGVALDDSKMYTMVLPDYIANGGDKCSFLIEQEREESEMLIRDAFLEHLKDNPQLESAIEGRIKLRD